MTEQIIREALADKERQRDRVDDANRFGRIEADHAVLRTRVDAAVKRFDEELDRAVSADDLKELKRELEAEVNTQVASQNAQQSKDILGEVRSLFADQKIQFAQDRIAQQNELLAAQTQMRSQIVRLGIGFALSVMGTVIAALIIFYLIGR